MFYESRVESIPYFRFQELESVPGFVHAFTSRATDEACGISDAAQGVFHKDRLIQALGIPQGSIVQSQQVHSDHILSTRDSDPGDRPEGDGWILHRPGLFAIIRSADCVPALIVDPDTQRVCLVHAGWKGTAAHILRKAVQRMLDHPESRADRLMVGIGPSIRSCCYEVGEEVRRQFKSRQHAIDRVFAGRHLDLVAANLRDAKSLGVRQVLDCGVCTSCSHSSFYSHRRKGDAGRMWMLAGFRSSETKVPVGSAAGA